MTTKQKEIEAIIQKIAKLEERLEYLSKFSDIEVETLSSFKDFPYVRTILFAIYSETQKRIMNEEGQKKNLKYEELTVYDLICCKEEKLLQYRGIGEGRIEQLRSFMQKHNLQFIEE